MHSDGRDQTVANRPIADIHPASSSLRMILTVSMLTPQKMDVTSLGARSGR